MDISKLHKNIFPDHDDFDNLVFEKRNKEYGAYFLRKQYKKSLTNALIISSVLFIILSLFLFFTSIEKQKRPENSYVYAEFSDLAIPNETLPKPLQSSAPPQKDQSNFVVIDDKTVPVDKNKLNLSDNLIVDSVKNTVDSLLNSRGTRGNGDSLSNGDGTFYFNVEQMPEFPGGKKGLLRYIQKNTQYPPIAVRKKIFGTVMVRFCITSKGTIDKVSVVKGVAPMLDDEAVRVIKAMPNWKPGIHSGMCVNVWFFQPINFAPI
jgi:periplasmic protein TonB